MSDAKRTVRTGEELVAIVEQSDIRSDGTLNPQARAFLERLLPHFVHDFSTLTHNTKADIEVTITLGKKVTR